MNSIIAHLYIIVRIGDRLSPVGDPPMPSRMLHFAAGAAGAAGAAAVATVAAVALIGAAPTWADDSVRGPNYLHALSELRDAREHLEHFGSEPVDARAERAIFEIDRAISAIKREAVTGGNDIENRVPVDTHMVHNGRFQKAMDLLDKARRDVAGEEDQPDAQALQQRVMRHIDEARHEVARAIAITRENS
jgi:hypothetical protein